MPPAQAGLGQRPVFQPLVSQPTFQVQDPFALLMQLNYQSQVKGFKAFLSKQRIGGCLVRSQPQVATEMGIKLLMKRLLNMVPSAREQPQQYKFDLASLVLNNGPDDIWAALALKLKLYQLVRPFNVQAQEEIAGKLGEQLARRHVFFIFKHVDADTVETLVSQFWEPLVGVVQKSVKLPEGGFLMLAFFLDNTGTILPQSGGKFIEIVAGEREHEAQPVGGWRPEQDGASFALPAVTDFTVADLDFLANHYDSQALDEVKQAMNLRADGKRPDFVLNILVDALNLEQNVGFESWLNQY
jgi:hypothetical protein